MRTVRRDIVGAFIFSADDKLLLGKAGVYQDAWVVPGGGIEDGESVRQAVKREVAEETGIDITSGVIKQVEGAITGESEKTLRETGERVLVKMTFYNFTIKLSLPADRIVIKTEDDFKGARWVSIAELPNTTLSPPSVITLQKLGYLPKA